MDAVYDIEWTWYTVSPVELGWMAGLLEGEGTFWFENSRYRYPRVQIYMTDEDVVRRIAEVAGVGNVTGPHTRSGDDGRGSDMSLWKPQWGWTVTRKEQVYWLCRTILPYMGKRRTAKINELLATSSPRLF